jgi:nucleotide-binding universal stress UspA family protein
MRPTGGELRLVHVRTCDPPLPIVGRFYLATRGEATALMGEALLAAWACGGPSATTVVVDARRGDVAAAIASQAAAWPADLIVLTRRPRPALSRLLRGSVPDQVMRKASCPVLAIPPAKMTASTASPGRNPPYRSEPAGRDHYEPHPVRRAPHPPSPDPPDQPTRAS